MDVTRTFVLVDGKRIAGYFSLTMGHVLKSDAPPKMVRGTPNYPVGMVLLTRLALDLQYQGQGLGADLLGEALRMAVRGGEVAAARLIAVDAIDDDAIRFYRRHGFVMAPESSDRLYLRMKDVRRNLGLDP
jgi:Acetyltransferases